MAWSTHEVNPHPELNLMQIPSSKGMTQPSTVHRALFPLSLSLGASDKLKGKRKTSGSGRRDGTPPEAGRLAGFQACSRPGLAQSLVLVSLSSSLYFFLSLFPCLFRSRLRGSPARIDSLVSPRQSSYRKKPSFTSPRQSDKGPKGLDAGDGGEHSLGKIPVGGKKT